MATSGSLLAVFAAMFAMVFVWFVLVKLLHTRLERGHKAKYQAMGRPSLVLRNNPATVWATLAFIAKREHQSLGDASLSRLSDFMLAFLAAYVLLFAVFLFLVLRAA
jgi:hypothetical protein